MASAPQTFTKYHLGGILFLDPPYYTRIAMALINTDPELVEAAKAAVQHVEFDKSCTKVAFFSFRGYEWRTIFRFDPHANCVDYWDTHTI